MGMAAPMPSLRTVPVLVAKVAQTGIRPPPSTVSSPRLSGTSSGSSPPSPPSTFAILEFVHVALGATMSASPTAVLVGLAK